MRYYLAPLVVLGLLLPVTAEPADNAKPVNTIQEYKDIDLTEEYSDCLRILVEKYLLLGSYADGTFRPDQPLRRGELAGWLDRAASRAEQLINIVSDDFRGDKIQFRRANVPDGHQAGCLEAFEKLKDLPAADPCYANPRHLAEHFHLLVKGSPQAFGAQDPVSADEFSAYLQRLFQYKRGPKGAKPVTRGQAVDAFLDAFQFYLDRVEQKLQGK